MTSTTSASDSADVGEEAGDVVEHGPGLDPDVEDDGDRRGAGLGADRSCRRRHAGARAGHEDQVAGDPQVRDRRHAAAVRPATTTDFGADMPAP